MTYKVTKEIFFCYGHRLLNYRGKCRHLHGHNGKVEIELTANRLNSQGMVFDFEKIKRVVQRWIDQNLDHRMILSKNDPLLPFLKKHGEPLFLLDENPTAEKIAKQIYEYARSRRFPVSQVRVWETHTSFASYSE